MTNRITAHVRIDETFEVKAEDVTSFDHEELSKAEIEARVRSKIANTITDSLCSSPMQYISVDTEQNANPELDTRIELSVNDEGISITKYGYRKEQDKVFVLNEWWYTWAECSEALTGIPQPPDVV